MMIQIIKNLSLDVLSTQCGPNGTATSHAECKANRPWHPAEPDLKGLPDLITDARTVQVWLSLNIIRERFGSLYLNLVLKKLDR